MPFPIIPRIFWYIDSELAKIKTKGQLSDDIQDTLARNFGWYDAGGLWKKLNSDSQGRLLVSLNAGQTQSATLSLLNVTNAAAKVLQANTNRRGYLIQNTGGNNIYLGFDSTLTSAKGIILAPGASYNDNVYVGDVWAIAVVASVEARAVEF